VRLAAVAEGLLDAAAVVVAEVDLVIVFLGDMNAFFSKNLLEELEVEGLVVDQDAVEVEDDGADHGGGSD
jgi:hypothetical protein